MAVVREAALAWAWLGTGMLGQFSGNIAPSGLPMSKKTNVATTFRKDFQI